MSDTAYMLAYNPLPRLISKSSRSMMLDITMTLALSVSSDRGAFYFRRKGQCTDDQPSACLQVIPAAGRATMRR